MDDWLITPGFKLKEGYCYRIEFEAKIGLSGENERLEVMLGKGATPELMTISGLAATEITSTTYTRYSFETVCTESSTYYLGFHGISDPFKYYLYVNNISISTGSEAITPRCRERTAVSRARPRRRTQGRHIFQGAYHRPKRRAAQCHNTYRDSTQRCGDTRVRLLRPAKN